LTALYERGFHRFLRVAEAIVGEAGLAEDVVQEAFARAIRRLPMRHSLSAVRGVRGAVPRCEARLLRVHGRRELRKLGVERGREHRAK